MAARQPAAYDRWADHALAAVPKRDGTFQSTYFHITKYLNPQLWVCFGARAPRKEHIE
jgi:hypothetical protein